jgi:GTP cyclohydrolase I
MSISKHTGCPDVGVYIEATHGCVSCRGVNQQNSLTQSSFLMGGFRNDPSVKEEFFDNIKLQKGTR